MERISESEALEIRKRSRRHLIEGLAKGEFGLDLLLDVIDAALSATLNTRDLIVASRAERARMLQEEDATGVPDDIRELLTSILTQDDDSVEMRVLNFIANTSHVNAMDDVRGAIIRALSSYLTSGKGAGSGGGK